MQPEPTYPLTLQGDPTPNPSRWLWIVKFILVIPHVIVLAFLWIAYCVLWIVAFFAILFTARYPQSIFRFNVGVLRWTWRVGYYSFSANGTDLYPPFTLEEVPGYPAHLDVEYPGRLSRGLVLVKWWLLAIPHLIIVAVFAGGAWYAYRNSDIWVPAGAGGLIGILLFVALLILLFTDKYPQSLYDFILGMDRWVFRVAAYTGLMTDRYPPFRMDMGGPDPGAVSAPPGAVPPAPGVAAPAQSVAPAAPATPGLPPPPAPQVRASTSGWTGGKVVALIAGCFLALVSLGFLFSGGAALWADRTQRDGDGYVTTPTHRYTTPAAAVTTESVDMSSSPDWVPALALGDVRVEATPAGSDSVFVGIGPSEEVGAYLAGVSRETIQDPWSNSVESSPGGAASAPADQTFWAASTSGEGPQTVDWDATGGSWTVVAMNPDGHEGLDVSIRAAATVPALGWIAGALLLLGLVLLVGGTLLIVFSVHRASAAR